MILERKNTKNNLKKNEQILHDYICEQKIW